MNLLEQLDEFWREILGQDRSVIQTKYPEFVGKIQAQIAHLPQPEQDRLLWEVVHRNAEYIAVAQRDRNALKGMLGLPALSPEANRLVQVATDTAVRATVWHGISAIFRAFR